MNKILHKIAFLFVKGDCYVCNIESHGKLNKNKTLIYRDGSEFVFDGDPSGKNFHLYANSVRSAQSPFEENTNPKTLDDLILALKRYGFENVILCDSKV